ncbi:MAG: 50S ribosomal protein L33 [Patescibacteria group bacterium]|nr:50S ribosomal protein L33 [Patescibacteria group bacterium]
MAPKKKGGSRKIKRPLLKMICSKCKDCTVRTFKNPTNTPDRLELKKYCKRCKSRQIFKETK